MKYKIVIICIIAILPVIAYAQETPVWDLGLKNNLQRMADSLSNNLKPWTVQDKIFKVEDFGALADGQTINTISIQNAIDSCSKSGGGVVLFSSGDYVTGTIELKSDVMLEVSEGARILGSINLADYPEKIEQFKSVMSENHKYRQSLIFADRAKNIGIRGKGEIYFRGEKTNFPGTQTTGEIIGRPFGIRIIECSNVVLQDIYLHNAAAWMQSYLYCKDLIFDGIKVVNQANYNNDGLDADGCTNVIVRNSFISSEDDAMCLKGCSDRTTQNVLIENSTFVTTCNALKIGTDTQGDFINVICRNLKLGGVPDTLPTIAGRQASTGITLATVDGGNVENILIHDVNINQARCPVFIRIGNRGRVMPGISKPPAGYLKKVLIENVTGEKNYKQGSMIIGISTKSIEDVIIRNYNLSMEGGVDSLIAGLEVPENDGGYPDAHQFSVDGLPSYGFFVRHAKNITFENTIITPVKTDGRPCFIHGGNVEKVIANNIPIEKQVLISNIYEPEYISKVVINPSSSAYTILPAKIGMKFYTDRTYVFTKVPSELEGAEFICWPNGLKGTVNDGILSFTVNTDGIIYVAHDNRLLRPDWLKNEFTATTINILVNDAQMTLFEKKVKKDELIKTGGNQVNGTVTSQSTNYIVFFYPKADEVNAIVSENKSDLVVYPNPVHTELVINPQGEIYANYQIFNISGNMVSSGKLGAANIYRIPLALSQGLYILNISNKTKCKTVRFVIE